MPAKGTKNNPRGINQYSPGERVGRRTSLENAEKKLVNHLSDQLGVPLHDPLIEDASLPELSLDRVELKDDWFPTQENLDRLYQLAMTGVDEQTLASIAIGVPDSKYFELRAKYPEIQETIQTAQRHAQAVMAIELFNEMCRKGNKNRQSAIKFYLENRSRWAKEVGVPLPTIPNHHSNRPIEKLNDNELTRLLKKGVDEILEPDDQ